VRHGLTLKRRRSVSPKFKQWASILWLFYHFVPDLSPSETMSTLPTVSLFITYPELVYSGGRYCRQLFEGRRSVSDAVDVTLSIDREAIIAAYLTSNGRVRAYLPGGAA
jgi:hypothetical protein